MSRTEVKINLSEAVRYMGYREPPADNEMAFIRERAALIEKNVKPAVVYRLFDIGETFHGVKLKLTGITLTGEDIKRHLAGCEKCILLCATVGLKADELIRRAQAEDISAGFVTDCLASAAVESVCNGFEQEIRAALPEWYMTWRFSPGYGDLPLSLQPDILTVLNAPKRVGVTCLDSLLMVPSKSVTAVIGLSSKPIERRRLGCAICNMADRCTFRKSGTRCRNSG